MPLFDAYAGPTREQTRDDPRLNPILKDLRDLPEDLLLIVPAIDILVHEQLAFIQRLRQEQRSREVDQERTFEAIVFDKGFHGWLECKNVFSRSIFELSCWRSALLGYR